MNESAKFEVYKKKLQGICDEHNLVYSFKKDRYPITLVVQTTGGLGGQMSMFENAEEDGYRSPDARLVFAIKDGDLDIQISETFTISETLLNKLKNLFKCMHSLWLQFFFRDLMERKALDESQMPIIDGDEDGDTEEENSDEMQEALDNLEPGEDDGESEEEVAYEYADPSDIDEA